MTVAAEVYTTKMRQAAAERKKAPARELAFEIIWESDAILFKCNYHKGDMLREKFK